MRTGAGPEARGGGLHGSKACHPLQNTGMGRTGLVRAGGGGQGLSKGTHAVQPQALSCLLGAQRGQLVGDLMTAFYR